MWNKAKCILLKTKENSGLLLGLSKFGRLVSYDTKYVNLDNDAYNVKQHLYIINDDVIKEGWIIGLDDKPHYVTEKGKYPKVILATTNSDLHKFGRLIYSLEIGLPQIPQSFIEQYITEYNQGKIIESILVEYEGIEWLDKPLEYFPKINSDNTINIKTVKDSFSKEEVEVLLFNLAEHYGMTSTKSEIDDFNIWISENL